MLSTEFAIEKGMGDWNKSILHHCSALHWIVAQMNCANTAYPPLYFSHGRRVKGPALFELFAQTWLSMEGGVDPWCSS